MTAAPQAISIFGTLGTDVTSVGVSQQLALLDRSQPLKVLVNSGGGSAQEGVALYNLLRSWPAGVDVEIVGWALSAASVVIMAGRRIQAHPTALVMVHAPWMSTTGNASELRETAQTLEQVADSMAAAYARTGQKPTVIAQWLDGTSDRWFTADEALRVGLIDEILTETASTVAHAATRHPIPAHIQQRILAMPTPQPFTAPAATAHQPLPPQAALPTAPAQPTPNAASVELVRRGEVHDTFDSIGARWGDLSALRAQCLADPSVTRDEASRRILAHIGRGASPAAGGYVVDVTGPGTSDFMQAASHALMARAGIRVDQPHPQARELRHMSIVAMAETLLSRLGKAPLSRSPNDIIQAAMSTSDFPGLLGDVAHKSLRTGYVEAPVTYTQWTGEREIPDFRPQTLALLSEAPDLQFRAELGEYKFGSMDESYTTFKVETYGRIVRLSRESLINDDLSAFTDVPRSQGAAARRLEADKVYGMLTSNPALKDGKALFHADHGNLTTTNSQTLGLVALSAARGAMRLQKGIAGSSFIDPQPRFVIVPVAMETWAEQELATLTSAAKGTQVAPEWVRNLVLLADPRLDAVSTTDWYLAADPKQIDGIVRAYLAGADRPFLDEFEEKGFDAMNYKVRLEFGVGVVDYRGLHKVKFVQS